MLEKNYLGIIDYAVIAFCLLFSLFIGVFYATKGRKKSNNDELLVGSRNMGAIPVAASILVSYLSAITILGYPAEVYTYGSQIFLTTLNNLFITPIGIFIFVKVMYDLKLTSAYKYLELRYDSILVRWIGSLIFIVQLLFISGIVLYAPSIVLKSMMGVPVYISVIGIGIIGTIYTSIGGIKAVVWTDVFQFLMIFIGMSAIVVKGVYSSGGVTEMFKRASDGGRLELFNWTVDPFMRHNTLNIMLGNGFSGLVFLTHQPVLQRYCGLPSFREAVKSVFCSTIFGLVTIGLVILTGIAIFAHYADCDPLKSGQIEKSDQIVPFFVIEELAYPGMLGLFVAVVFSAVLSTVSSTLNSLAAVTWEDFLSKIPFFSEMGDFGQTCVYKILSILYGAICIGLAFSAEHFGSIFQGAITVVGAAIGVLGSVFLMGVFMPFVNKRGAISGLIVGIVSMSFITIQAIILQKSHNFQPKLNVSIEECPAEILLNFNNNTAANSIMMDANDLEWPRKLFTISYMLYSFIGGVITISVGCIVSLLTNGCKHAKYVRPEYLHPLIRPSEKVDTNSSMPIQSIPKAHINKGYESDRNQNIRMSEFSSLESRS